MASKFAHREAKEYTKLRSIFQYLIVYFILSPYFRLFYRVKISGKENLPKGRSFIVAASHMSYLDPVIVSYCISRPIAYMAKEELFHVPFLSQWIRLLGAFAVNRTKLEIATIRTAKAVISTNHWILAMFPQGTRIKSGFIGKINVGFAYLAKATKAEIIPVSIVGADKYSFFPFSRSLTVTIGKPLPVPTDMDETRDQWGKAISEMTGFYYDKEESLDLVKEVV